VEHQIRAVELLGQWYANSVPEVTHASEYHRNAMSVGRGDDFIVAHGPTRLSDRRDTRIGRRFNTVWKRKECVTREAARNGLLACYPRCDPDTLDTVRLARADADDPARLCQDNSVRLHETYRVPREFKRLKLLGSWTGLSDTDPLERCDSGEILILYQQSAWNRPHLKPRDPVWFRNPNHPEISLPTQTFQSHVLIVWSNHDVKSMATDFFGKFSSHGTITCQDSTER
jgi:hypothetical protein